jgi:hypothetical protein
VAVKKMEIQIVKKMKAVNTARGRKGAWHMKNTTRWAHKDNKAAEQVVYERMAFIHEFIHETDVVLTEEMYAAGLVREATYGFHMVPTHRAEVIETRAYGNLLIPSQ